LIILKLNLTKTIDMKAEEIVDDIREMPKLSNREAYQENVKKINDFANQKVIEEIDGALELIEKGELKNIESYLLGRLMVAEKETN
jgi:hypothetical protein